MLVTNLLKIKFLSDIFSPNPTLTASLNMVDKLSSSKR